MGFKKATRENIWVKVLMIGSSGGGKTYSSLRMAKGFANKLSKITGQEERVALIDSESRRSTYYADEFDFDILELKPPFTPERYMEAINEAINSGYKVLVVDSITHEWSGKGGCLEIHSKIPGNSYTAWAKVTPRHEAFFDTIIDSPIHIFATVRGEDKYVLEEVNGKQIPRKVPIGYDQRKNTEYLFTVSFMLEQDTHIATAVKDNTHIFEDKNDVLTEQHGELLCNWANSGDVSSKKRELEKEKQEAKLKIKAEEEKEAKEMAEKLEKERQKQIYNNLDSDKDMGNIIQEIKSICDSLVDKNKLSKEEIDNNKQKLIKSIKKYHTSANYNTIDDLDVAKKVLEELRNLK